jgi:hypothetical protein
VTHRHRRSRRPLRARLETAVTWSRDPEEGHEQRAYERDHS